MLRAVRPYAVIAAIVLASAAAFGVDSPDALVNPASGLIETVDATWSGSNYNVRYTEVTSGGEQTKSFLLTSNTANDVDPRISTSATGDAVVAWWRDLATDAVIYRKHSFTTGAWGPERVAGGTKSSNSHPRVTYDGDKPWVAYQIQNSKSQSVGVQIIDDTPEPICSIVATTSYTGNLDIRLHAASGHLWVTWMDSSSYVGYSEYSHSVRLWSLPAWEPLGGGSVSGALSRIESRILGY